MTASQHFDIFYGLTVARARVARLMAENDNPMAGAFLEVELREIERALAALSEIPLQPERRAA
jgi:hypothetical protein